jgi:hypothetical protein
MANVKPLVILPYDKTDTYGGASSPQALPPQAMPTDSSGSRGVPPPNPPQPDPIQKRSRSRYGRLTTILKIFKKLDQINAFNEDFNIIREDGSSIENSDIAKLLNVTQTHVRSNKGITELIRYLHLAKIDPDLIVNETIKARLLEMSGVKNSIEVRDNETTITRPNSPADNSSDTEYLGFPEDNRYSSVSDVSIKEDQVNDTIAKQPISPPVNNKRKRSVRENSPTDVRTPSPDFKRPKFSKEQTEIEFKKLIDGMQKKSKPFPDDTRVDEYLKDYYSNPNNPPLSISGLAKIRKRLREESPTDIRTPSPPNKKSKNDDNEPALADIDERLQDIKQGNSWEIPF